LPQPEGKWSGGICKKVIEEIAEHEQKDGDDDEAENFGPGEVPFYWNIFHRSTNQPFFFGKGG
jgi:hypothetical protein